jgi:hypothetical protein
MIGPLLPFAGVVLMRASTKNEYAPAVAFDLVNSAQWKSGGFSR